MLANDRESLAAMSFRERGEIVAQAQANLFTAEYVIGSSAKMALMRNEGKLATYRKPGWQSLNVGKYKALNLQLHAGRRPILAVGNSDGDLDMLQFTQDHSLPTLVLVLEHDDADREYAYVDDAQR